jgi:hypothetical protein
MDVTFPLCLAPSPQSQLLPCGREAVSEHISKPCVSFSGSPLALGPPQINTWHETGHLSDVLGLSPSLFSSPSKILPEQTLKDDRYYLTKGELPGHEGCLICSQNMGCPTAMYSGLCRACWIPRGEPAQTLPREPAQCSGSHRPCDKGKAQARSHVLYLRKLTCEQNLDMT